MKKIPKSRVAGLLSMLFLLVFAACGSLPEEAAQYAAGTQDTAGQTTEERAESTKHAGTLDGSAQKTGDSTLEVHYIDVGQGDATLITCDGHAMLIDAGNNDKGTAVQSYLMHQNVTALDYVIATHPDADHIGGLDVVITKFDCGTIFMTDDEKDTTAKQLRSSEIPMRLAAQRLRSSVRQSLASIPTEIRSRSSYSMETTVFSLKGMRKNRKRRISYRPGLISRQMYTKRDIMAVRLLQVTRCLRQSARSTR